MSFCAACGAEKIYATGDGLLEAYPLHTAVLEMRGIPNVEEPLIESLFGNGGHGDPVAGPLQ